MVKANTKIIVAGKTFMCGQTVSGLSAIDKEWMKDAGYITELADKERLLEEEIKEGVANGEL